MQFAFNSFEEKKYANNSKVLPKVLHPITLKLKKNKQKIRSRIKKNIIIKYNLKKGIEDENKRLVAPRQSNLRNHNKNNNRENQTIISKNFDFKGFSLLLLGFIRM